jgi:hypothetical protein
MNGTELNLDFSSKMREILNARGKAMLGGLRTGRAAPERPGRALRARRKP